MVVKGLQEFGLHTRVISWLRATCLVRVDCFGGASEDAAKESNLQNLCFVIAVRALGVPLEVTVPGPIWALRGGNLLLEPLGWHLVHVQPGLHQGPGDYVRWNASPKGLGHVGHFTAVTVGQQIKVTDGDTVSIYANFQDAATGLRESWFRLCKGTAPTQERLRTMAMNLLETQRRQFCRSFVNEQHVGFSTELIIAINENRMLAVVRRAEQKEYLARNRSRTAHDVAPPVKLHLEALHTHTSEMLGSSSWTIHVSIS